MSTGDAGGAALSNADAGSGVRSLRNQTPLSTEVPGTLGPKAAVVHARRMQRSLSKQAARRTDRDSDSGSRLASEDNAVEFVLQAGPHGLFVERTQRRPLGAVLTMAMVFSSSDDFNRWCEADPVRFDHPVLYSRLRRQGDDLLADRS